MLKQLLYRNVQRLRGGLAVKAHRLRVYLSTLGMRVIQKKPRGRLAQILDGGTFGQFPLCCPPRQKSRVKPFEEKVKDLLTQVAVENLWQVVGV